MHFYVITLAPENGGFSVIVAFEASVISMLITEKKALLNAAY